MKNFIVKLLVTLGFVSFFNGTSEQFKVHAKESSATAAGGRSESMGGGRSGGCGKSG